jgi:hypothetical protein
VQADAEGVIVDQEGQFEQLGKVYYSPESTANILSYAAMVDAGHDVSYDGQNVRFLLRPLESKRVLTFSKKRVDGSENRFYCCNMTSIIGTEPPTPPVHRILLGTVTENMKLYPKREGAGADKARVMLARMGYPSLKQAIDICSSGRNFDITARDFQIADAIYGKDIASIKGKTTKHQTRVAVETSIVQQEQVLLVDVMFVEGVPSLIGLSHPLDLTLCKTLLDFDPSQPFRSATIVKAGIESFITKLLSRDFKTKRIMSDREGAIPKLTSHLNSLGMAGQSI